MGTPKAQHQPPPQLLFLILLSCPWIQGKDMGSWGWAHESPRGALYLPFSEHPGLSKLLRQGKDTADGKGLTRAF